MSHITKIPSSKTRVKVVNKLADSTLEIGSKGYIDGYSNGYAIFVDTETLKISTVRGSIVSFVFEADIRIPS